MGPSFSVRSFWARFEIYGSTIGVLNVILILAVGCSERSAGSGHPWPMFQSGTSSARFVGALPKSRALKEDAGSLKTLCLQFDIPKRRNVHELKRRFAPGHLLLSM